MNFEQLNIAVTTLSFIDTLKDAGPHLGLVLGIVLVCALKFFLSAKESNEERLKKIEQRFYTRIFILFITSAFTIIVYPNEAVFLLSLLVFAITLIGFLLDLMDRRRILKKIHDDSSSVN